MLKYKCEGKDCDFETDDDKEMINHYLDDETTLSERIDILHFIVGIIP